MIKARIYLEDYDWTVTVYMAVHGYHIREIMSDLSRMGAGVMFMDEAYDNMHSGNLDTGLCYTNRNEHRSLIVTSLASNAAEFFNSITHEITHLCTHISDALGINLRSEGKCYLAGEFAMRLYPYCKDLLCCHCHEKSGS